MVVSGLVFVRVIVCLEMGFSGSFPVPPLSRGARGDRVCCLIQPPRSVPISLMSFATCSYLSVGRMVKSWRRRV